MPVGISVLIEDCIMFQLSRFVARSGSGQSHFLVRCLSTTAVRSAEVGNWMDAPIFANEKGPERDHVNFPRRIIQKDPAPVRHLWIPVNYFKFFHQKTGVTGPYAFAGTTLTFLLSKEYWVLEHEFWCGVALVTVLASIVKFAGPGINAWLTKLADEQEAGLKAIRGNEIERCKAAIAEEEHGQWMATSYKELMEAKKENVALQLEVEYRSRLNDAYKQVKRRLDYQLTTANVLRSSEQKHMVQWILNNVRKAITEKQEADALKACVADLKALAK